MTRRRQAKPSVGDIVRIEWVDARSWQAWTALKEAKTLVAHPITVGFLIADDKNGLSITGTITEDNWQYSDSIDIPRPCVKSVKVIERRDALWLRKAKG